MNKSKAAVVVSQIWQKVETILGWLFIVLMVFALLGSLTSKDNPGITGGDVVGYGIFIGLGAFLIIKGNKRKKLIRDFKNYVQILAGDPYNSLDTIAERSNTTVDVVKKNLQHMIKKNYFANAVIDEGSNSLILNGRADTQQILSAKAMESLPKVPPVQYQNPAQYSGAIQYQSPVQPQPQIEMLTIKCKGCGAVNVVPRGKVVECEYCGNMIKGE